MRQLDLFCHVPAPVEPPPYDEVARTVIGLDSIEDEELVTRITAAAREDVKKYDWSYLRGQWVAAYHELRDSKSLR